MHRLVTGRPLVLGGVCIPHECGLDGHSDADVIIHAVIDSLLGALGKGDIGQRFPNSDPRWKGADSKELLRDVMAEVSRERWGVVNVDITVLAEAPKLAPHLHAMKAALSPLLGISPEACGIKATTNERLGAIGRREGIFASCVALLYHLGS